MTPEKSRRDEAARWLAQTRKDLNAASLLASAEPSRSVFHSRQATGKAAKVSPTFHEVPLPQDTRPERDLLAGKEIAKMLQLQRQVCRYLGIQAEVEDREAEVFATDTGVADLASDVEKKPP